MYIEVLSCCEASLKSDLFALVDIALHNAKHLKKKFKKKFDFLKTMNDALQIEGVPVVDGYSSEEVQELLNWIYATDIKEVEISIKQDLKLLLKDGTIVGEDDALHNIAVTPWDKVR